MRAAGAGSLLAIGFILGVACTALAQATDQQTMVLHLSQTAERSVLRDVLRIELRVEETGADPLAIQSAINRRMAAALDRASRARRAGRNRGIRCR
jgi:predicted secreted protein